ncbi:MAG: carboxypeptidase-like regulatory domain-containing protein, partial [Nitrospirae bacterium]|nr:carboxypeptidase-like regulatory domain-containing protein [Nitrospirota bacterium]
MDVKTQIPFYVFREVIMKTGRLIRYVILTILFILLLSKTALSYEIRIEGNIPLKDKITGLSVNPVTGIALAISSESKTLYLIALPSLTIINRFPLTVTPTGLAVDTMRNIAIISSKDGTLNFIDLETGNTIKTLTVKRHSAPPIKTFEGMLDAESSTIQTIAINPKSDTLYIANGSSLMLMDLETEAITKGTLLPYVPISMAIDHNLGYLVLLISSDIRHPASGILHLYNADTLEPITSGIVHPASGIGYSGIAVNPSTHIAVLTNPSDNSITVISLSSCIMNPASCISILDTIPFYENPNAIAIDPSWNIALIAYRDGIALVKLENPIPKIDLLIPQGTTAGSPELGLSIKGSKFTRESRARFNLKESRTFFESNESLKAIVPSEELSQPGDIPVNVINPSPGGGISNTLFFNILNPVPVIDSLTPDTVGLRSPPITLKVRGKNFLPSAVVNLNGTDLKTRFISSILLEAELNPPDLKSPGKYIVVVINKGYGISTSNPVWLNVVEELPSALSPQPSGIRDQKSDKHPASGIGHLTGRILNTRKQPIEGVTVQIKGIKAVTDANGYFTLENVPSGKQHLMIHGSGAIAKYRETPHLREKESYHPTIPLTVDIDADRIKEMPFQIYLHKQKNWDFKDINPNEDTILKDPDVPGVEMRIPKGVKITGWDGKPNQRVSVRTVPTDKLPVKPLPQNAFVRTVYMFYFDKIGGGTADQPIPFKAPNDLGLLPGQKAVLWYYDESPNEGEAPNDWAIAGT